MKKILLIFSLMVSSLMANEAVKIFEKKCATCHMMTQPFTQEQHNQMVAPPILNVMNHLAMEFDNETSMVKHIKEMVMEPKMDKVICPSVQKFGLMPSQKGNITEEELEKVAKLISATVMYRKSKHGTQAGGCSGQKGGCSGQKGGCSGSCSSKKKK